MKIINKIYTAVLIRVYLVLKKSGLFKNSFVYITAGLLKNYKWSLYTSDETYLSGNFDTDTLIELKKHLKQSHVVYDLGANEGYYSLIATKLIGEKGYVYAFEPFPENVEKLNAHVKINGVNNVSVIDKAVSNKSGTLLFSKTSDQAGNTYIDSSPRFNEIPDKLEVKSVSVDDFCLSDGNKPPNLIKIDVEGAEYDVLCGAKQTIENYKPVIILATHDFHLKGVKDKCVNFLSGLSYKYYQLNNHDRSDFSDFLFYPA